VALRNPISGDIGGCVSSLQGNNCITGAFGSMRSLAFRSRGVAASYSQRFGAIDAGLGLGYDHRKYFAASNTVIGAFDNQADDNYWVTAYLNGTIDPRSGWTTNAYASIVRSDAALSDLTNVGFSAAYYRMLTRRLRAHAAASIDGIIGNDDLFQDAWNASALVGMRYSF